MPKQIKYVKKNLLFTKILVFLIILVMVTFGLSTKVSAYTWPQIFATSTATLEPPVVDGLAYLQYKNANKTNAYLAKAPIVSVKNHDLNRNNETISQLNQTNSDCSYSQVKAAPRGQWIAIEMNCEETTYVQAVNTKSGKIKIVGENLGRDNLLVGWVPNGKELVIKTNIVEKPQIYLVNIENNKASLLPVPSITYHVAVTSDGKHILYSTTEGVISGSNTWVSDIDGNNARLIIKDETNIIAYATWSPKGDQIAFIRIPDNNIPFTLGELWVADSQGNNAIFLAPVDAGHGYELTWSQDGNKLAFVGRENPNDWTANYDESKLISEIYTVNVVTRKADRITNLNKKATNPTWSPNGDFIAFGVASDNNSEIWVYDARSGQTYPVKNDGNVMLPTWLIAP